MSKVWIVGTGGELAPDGPKRTAGTNLLRMARMPLADYKQTFNIVNAEEKPVLPGGVKVIVLGKDAWRSVFSTAPPKFWFDSVVFSQGSIKATLVPHPHGMNLFYQSSGNRARLGKLLRESAGYEREETNQ